jgi:hypothetical protein
MHGNGNHFVLKSASPEQGFRIMIPLLENALSQNGDGAVQQHEPK